MAEKRKTRLPSEICQLMAEEMRAYKHDCALLSQRISYDEMAESVYEHLNSKGLIKHTP